MVEAAGRRRRAGSDVELEREAETILDVHGRDREAGFVVRVATRPILAHGDAAWQVARLESAVHAGSSRVQNIELTGRRLEFGSKHLIATSAHDQERVASAVAIDRDEVVAERLVETWRRRGRLHGDLFVEVDVLSHPLLARN